MYQNEDGQLTGSVSGNAGSTPVVDKSSKVYANWKTIAVVVVIAVIGFAIALS